MPGEEVVFEFGLPEFGMLALVLVGIYTIFYLLSSVAQRQREHLARMAREARADVAEEEESAASELDEPSSS